MEEFFTKVLNESIKKCKNPFPPLIDLALCFSGGTKNTLIKPSACFFCRVNAGGDFLRTRKTVTGTFLKKVRMDEISNYAPGLTSHHSR
jgi:hypothetical protein